MKKTSTLFKRLFLLLALTTSTCTTQLYAEIQTTTYTHVFSSAEVGQKFQDNMELDLSGTTWVLSNVSSSYNYNDRYAGMQLGSTSFLGSITFTTKEIWGAESNSYQGFTTVKKITVWLNNGSGAISATVKIGGVEATASGTVGSNSMLDGDYTKTSPIVYTPAENANTGKIEISLATAKNNSDRTKASYYGCFQVECEGDITPANVICLPSLSNTFAGKSIDFSYKVTDATNDEFKSLNYYKDGDEQNVITQDTESILFHEVGVYHVTVTVNSNRGELTSDPVTITITERPSYIHLVRFVDWDGTELSKEFVEQGNSATPPEVSDRLGYKHSGWDKSYTNVSQDLTITALYEAILYTEDCNIKLPIAPLFYDVHSNGKLQPVRLINQHVNICSPYSTEMTTESSLSSYFSPAYLGDLNNDGTVDIGCFYNSGSYSGSEDYHTMLSSEIGYTKWEKALMVRNMDMNNDGRPDVMASASSNGLSYHEQQPDGSFTLKECAVMTANEYQSLGNTQWASTVNAPSTYARGMKYALNVQFIGAALARRANAEDNDEGGELRSSLDVSELIDLPTIAIDMNGDGLTDLINERTGTIYFNTGTDVWLYENIGTRVIPVDLNGDGMMDFVYPGAKLKACIYRGDGEFETSTLFSNATVDNTVYCYDFDRDGDVDILLTVSSYWNTSTGYSYSLILKNDGNGGFTKASNTQSYGTDNMIFSACQDIDGDGLYDLLAIRGPKNTNNESGTGAFPEGTLDIVVFKGKANLTFETPQTLFTVENTKKDRYSSLWYNDRNHTSYNDVRINAEDIDGDGQLEIWLSGRVNEHLDKTVVAHNPTNIPTPSAPTKPILLYDNGKLTVNWGNGSDPLTPTADLTYSLRIGTHSGGNDILNGEALQSGKRINLLDGNMGRYHSYKIDLTSYPLSDIYVSIQTVNAQHAGSAWSDEAVISHNALSAKFTIDNLNATLNDEIRATFAPMPDGYTRTWDIGDGSIEEENEQGGYTIFKFSTGGHKTIKMTLQAPDGTASTTMEKYTVLPNYVASQAWPGDAIFPNTTFGDYNYDGWLDFYYGGKVYDGAENFVDARAAGGFWNTNLPNTNRRYFDWNHDGYADFMYNTYSPQEGRYLKHDNVSDFDEDYIQDDAFYHLLTSGNDKVADFIHSGYPEYTLRGDIYVYENGAYTVAYTMQDNSQDALGLRDQKDSYIDMNHDGFVDITGIQCRNGEPYSNLGILQNNGSGSFTLVKIPFEQAIASSCNDDRDLYNMQIADLDADGYNDIVALRSDGKPFIMWNNGNEQFSKPEILHGNNIVSRNRNSLTIADLDNDGYKDIITEVRSSKDHYGVYIFYMDANRKVKSEGFLTEIRKYGNFDKTSVMINSGVIGLYNQSTKEMIKILGPTNEKPSVPKNVRAVQTDEGLLIEWDAATDDHTKAVNLRYNLAVKRFGQSGEGSYLISPQNGLQSGVTAIPKYNYIEATRYLIPMRYLSEGKYEIQVQAIDLWNDMGDFSATCTTTVETVPSISAPSAVCVGEKAKFQYTGIQGGTLQWNWDGGSATAINNTTNSVTWSTPGLKTVTLTIAGKTITRQIMVNQINSGVTLPSHLFDNNTETIDIPAGLSYNWHFDNKPKSVKVNGKEITTSNAEGAMFNAYLTLTDGNGCQETIAGFDIDVISSNSLPAVSIVNADENGKQVIYFNDFDSNVFPMIRILRETSVRDLFMELATISSKNNSFTDQYSNAAQRAERYAVVGITADATEAPMSTVHQTLHLTINRGITDNTWNLIWNQYQGADIVSYNILRGASVDNLQQIASLSSYNTSYTDYSPDASQPFYAIEFVLGEPRRASVRSASLRSATIGRSNVVNSNSARDIKYASSITIQTLNNSYNLSEDEPMLQLIADVLPIEATYNDVLWEIISGEDLANINSSGLLTIQNPNAGGVCTVRATTLDGTSLSATANVSVAAIEDKDEPIITTIEEFDEGPVTLDTNTVPTAPKAYKVLVNGKIYIILPNGTKVNLMGFEVK